VSTAGFDNEPLFPGVSDTGPTAVGVIVKVWAAEELLNVRTMFEVIPPPEGVRVMVPVYAPFGVTTKLLEAVLSAPPEGPVNVKLVAGVTGVTGLDAVEAGLVP
jgi:hypothetical protein